VSRVSIVLLLVGMLVACGRHAPAPSPAPSPEASLVALRDEAARDSAAVAPASPRLGGRALIVLPDRDRLEANGIRRPSGKPASPQSVAYMVEVMQIGVIENVEALRRGRVFDAITVIGDADPAAVPTGDNDFKVWLLADSPDDWRWYVARADHPTRAQIAIDLRLDKTQRLNSFNAGVVQAAASLGAPAR
jgi:hypothetical protein